MRTHESFDSPSRMMYTVRLQPMVMPHDAAGDAVILEII